MGETYADRWNREQAQKGVKLPDGPQLVVLSGEWDQNVEVSELMDYEVTLDEAVAHALGELRSWKTRNPPEDDQSVEMMEVDYGPQRSCYITLVPDTNVMISYLPLIDSIVKVLLACPDLSISVLLPGIVMSELDGLRKATGRSCQEQAQDANRWAASELQKRAVVRGQRESATTAPGGNWRRYYYETGKENPDGFIIDAIYFEKSQTREGKWIVLTLDQNCAAQCLSNGIPVISPKKSSTVEDIFREVIDETPLQLSYSHQSAIRHLSAAGETPAPEASVRNRDTYRSGSRGQSSSIQTGEIDWANAPQVKSRPGYRGSARTVSSASTSIAPTVPLEMELDDHDHYLPVSKPSSPTPTRDNRDDLQDQLYSILESVIPPLTEESIRTHNTRDANVSMHALSASSSRKGQARGLPKRRLPSASSTEWKSWPIHEQVLFLADYAPPVPISSDPAASSKLPAKHKSPPSFPDTTRLAIQSLAALVRKDRRGREFGRGDWDKASIGFGVLCPQMEEAFTLAVREVFE